MPAQNVAVVAALVFSAGRSVHVDSHTFDWSQGVDVVGDLEDVAFVY